MTEEGHKLSAVYGVCSYDPGAFMDPPRAMGNRVAYMNPNLLRRMVLGQAQPYFKHVRDYVMSNSIEVSRPDLELVRDALDSATTDEIGNVEGTFAALAVVQTYLDELGADDNGDTAEAQVSGSEGCDAVDEAAAE